MTTPSLGQRIYPKYIIQTGLVLLFVGGFILARSLETASEASDMAWGLLIGGIAIGLIAGQLPNLILSGVEPKEASEASGLQGTAQNLGMALGTAVIGTVILTVALSSIGTQVEASTTIADETKAAIEEAVNDGFTSANQEVLAEELTTAPAEVQEEVETIYEDAALKGFQGAILVGGIVALLGALIAFRLPKERVEPEGEGIEQIVRDTVRNTTVAKLQFEMNDLPPSP